MDNPPFDLRQFRHDLNNHLAVIKLYAQLGLRDEQVVHAFGEAVQIILDEVGKALHLAGTLKEVKAPPGNDELSPERVKTLLSNLPGMAYRCRNAPGWPMEFISEGCKQLTEYRPDELISSGNLQFEDIIHPDDRQYVNDTIQEKVSQNQSFTLEYRIFTKSGLERRVWEKGRQIALSGEQGGNLEGFIMDITDKVKADEALHQTREKLMSIFRVSPSGIGMVVNRVFTEINDRISEMTGYSAAELLGKNSMILYPTVEDYEFVGKAKYEQIEKKGIGVVETRWLRKNGEIIDILMASTPLVPGDNSKGVIFTALDISNLKKAEAERKKIEEQLIQAQKMEVIGQLAGGVAHEFNNTLQVINTLSELSLLKLEENHPVIPYLEQIIVTVKQSSGFVSQLLAFARKQPVNPVPLDLNEFIGGTFQVLRRLIGDDIELRVSAATTLWSVYIDPVQLNQVLINLTLNARDAISGRGIISVSTANEIIDESYLGMSQDFRPGEYAMLTFTDNGSGIDETVLPKIFEPFFTTKPTGKGTGLGLSTVYGIVKQNHGFIIVDSKPGSGTSFRIYFPRHLHKITD